MSGENESRPAGCRCAMVGVLGVDRRRDALVPQPQRSRADVRPRLRNFGRQPGLNCGGRARTVKALCFSVMFLFSRCKIGGSERGGKPGCHGCPLRRGSVGLGLYSTWPDLPSPRLYTVSYQVAKLLRLPTVCFGQADPSPRKPRNMPEVDPCVRYPR